MRRTLILIAVAVFALLPSPATAGGAVDGDDFNLKVEHAYVSGDLWLEDHTAYLREIGELDCQYPQEWWDEVVIVDDSGAIIGYNEENYRAYMVKDIIAAGADASKFGDVGLFTTGSCYQGALVASGDCSDDDQVAVFALYGTRDVYRDITSLTSDFDVSWRLGNYCLVVVDEEDARDRLRGDTHVPDPIRATFPQFRTLVGLENSVWYDVADGLDPSNGGFTLAIETAGADYLLDVQIWLAGISIDIDGDGEWEYNHTCEDSATCTGSLEDPIYTFEYETRAFHTFTIRTLWAGYAVDEAGLILSIEPGMMWNEHTFDWETVEVRSSLDG